MSAELTFRQVAKHVSDEDLYVVIHDNVYNVSEFASEHPGGVEVLRSVAGEDATEAFEDVGHSDNARDTLAELKVGILKRDPEEEARKTKGTLMEKKDYSHLYGVLLIFGLAFYGVYRFLLQDHMEEG